MVTVDLIVECLGDGEMVCASILDFCKTFDSMDHQILLERLFQLNADPPMLKWF